MESHHNMEVTFRERSKLKLLNEYPFPSSIILIGPHVTQQMFNHSFAKIYKSNNSIEKMLNYFYFVS